MAQQKDINQRIRAILIDWLIDVHLKYKMVLQTMFISVNLIDRQISKNETCREKYQLIGVAAMFMSSNMKKYIP